MTNKLLSALGRVFTAFLQYHGFSLGVEDIIVTDDVSFSHFIIMCHAHNIEFRAT